MENNITFAVYDPNTGANPTDKYLAVVRNKGFIVDCQTENTRELATKWAEDYTKTMIADKVAPLYDSMLKRWANK